MIIKRITIKKIDSFTTATAATAVAFLLAAIGSAFGLIAMAVGSGSAGIEMTGFFKLKNPGVIAIILYPFGTALITWLLVSLCVGAINWALRLSGGFDVQCSIRDQE